MFDNRVKISDSEKWVYYPLLLVLNLKLPVENTVVIQQSSLPNLLSRQIKSNKGFFELRFLH